MCTTGRGFTLVELVIVIAILGILALIVVVPLSANTNRARHAELLADFGQVKRIIGTLNVTDEMYWRTCVDDSEAGRALRKIVKKYTKPQEYRDGSEMSPPYIVGEFTHVNYDPGQQSLFRHPHTFFGVANNDIFNGSEPNAPPDRVVSDDAEKRLGSTGFFLRHVRSGCLSAVQSEDDWRAGKRHSIVVWLRSVDPDGNILTLCADSMGEEDATQDSFPNNYVGLDTGNPSFVKKPRNEFTCASLLHDRHQSQDQEDQEQEDRESRDRRPTGR